MRCKPFLKIGLRLFNQIIYNVLTDLLGFARKMEYFCSKIFMYWLLAFLFHLQIGSASHYANSLEGNKTYSGDVFHQHMATAAHRTLPMGSLVLVVNPKNDKWIIVRINDRMGRSNHIIDLTTYGSKTLGFRGRTKVHIYRLL